MDLRDTVKAVGTPEMDRAATAVLIAEAIRTAGSYRWVGLYDVMPDEIAVIAYSGPAPPAYPTFSASKGLSGEAVRSRRTVVSNDVAQDARYLTNLETTGSEMIVPILAPDGRVVGTIDVESDKLDAFSDLDAAAVGACSEVVRERLFS
jgi:L-methionine (R)-S-oxide reductase